MAITVFGVYLLWTTVGVVDGSDQLKRMVDDDAASLSKLMKSLALPLVPKISLVIFIEVFAYFFLRLYKAGLEDIKYFQNELTNMESKFIALEIALLQKNSAAVKSVVDSLAKTERNFVLSKGETTVELERAKADSNFTKEILRNLPKIFSERSKGKDS